MAHNLTSHPSTAAPNPTAFSPRDRGGGRENMTRQCPEGQRFDPITKTCVPIAEVRPQPEERVFTDVETGQVSGVTTVAGETFLGIDRKDVEKVLAIEAGRELPETARVREEMELKKTEDLRTQLGILLSDKIGLIQPTGDVEQDKINYREALMSAFDELLIGAGTGAAAGFMAGGGPIGAAALGVVGSVAGFYKGVSGNIGAQRVDILKGEAQNLMKAEQNLLKTVMLANSGGDPVVALNMFNSQLSLIDEYHAKLKLETSDNLADWVGEDGHKQLEKFIMFNTVGGMRDIVSEQMRVALLTPDPSRNDLIASQIQIISDEAERI